MVTNHEGRCACSLTLMRISPNDSSASHCSISDADDVPAFVQSVLPEGQVRVVQTEELSLVCLEKPPNMLLVSVVLMSRIGSVSVTTAAGSMWAQAPHDNLQALLELPVEIEHLLAGCERQGIFFGWDHPGRPSL